MRRTALSILFSCVILSAAAQKLPKVQRASLYAPENIKVDGKLNEWDDKLQAYNYATDVYYTISNDDKNLYITLKATKDYIVNNIIKYGVRFTVNHTINKKDPSPIIITYPVLNKSDRATITNRIGSRSFEGANKSENNFDEIINELLRLKSKFISVEGLVNVTDKDLSVINDKNIIVASTFQKPFAYIYELALPLKFLSSDTVGINKFSYQIKLNYPNANEITTPPRPIPDNVMVIYEPPIYLGVTYFWGEYTLAKK